MDILAVVALLLITVIWATIPLLPALSELYRPTDVDPLTMVGRDNADISRFARHFREYVLHNLSRLPAEASTGDYFGKLPDGTLFVRVASRPEALGKGGLPDGSFDRLVVLEHPVELGGGEQFRLELIARDTFSGGRNGVYRAILGEKTVQLGAGSSVLRWAHGVGELTAGPDCALYGRTSSDTAIRLEAGTGFERLGAPVIVAGTGPVPEPPPTSAEGMPAFQAPGEAERLGDHLRIEGHLTIPPRTVFEGNLVVAGRLTIGTGALIRGRIKAHGEVDVEPGAAVSGALVSRSRIALGARSWVAGPVIGEEEVELGPGAVAGVAEVPTTVSGRTVLLAAGAAVHGHVVTREGGAVTG